MSTEIDKRVVQMEFDNKRFESNVATTMSTLDKLKQKLNFSGATKGLAEVSTAANNVNMTGLGKAVETVNAKFSALQVMGVTALANITNSAVNAGKRIVSALTIQPITTGFSEYELKMNSVQTIMASTGETLEVVNHHLEELNKYSDQTIYSFSDMTQNIGKFTNAGVKLEDAVLAMKGISNEAALSGANANEASRAMYNFAQALSVGYVQRIDWKSIELANMATVEFKDQLLASAIAAGTVKKNAEGMYATLENPDKAYTAAAMFTETLDDQWLTTEVLINTLKDYADTTTDVGKRATKAATEVKTATQLFDTLKESAQSGWAQTWEIIVGDFYEAKNVFTYLSDAIGGFIGKMSDARNNFLKGVLNSKWENLTDKIEEAGISTEDFQDRIKKLAKEHNVDLDKMIKKEGSFEKALQKAFNTKKLDKSIISKALKSFIGDITGTTKAAEKAGKSMKELGEVVNKVIRGDFGNGAERIEKLTKAGYDYATVQNLVNEKLGISKRHTSALTEEQLKNADSLSKLSDEQLKNKGYTDEQIKSIRILAEQADKAGTSISDLIDDIEKPSGRELLFESLRNILEAIQKPLNSFKEAWQETFGDIDGESAVYKAIEWFRDLTEAMIISDESAENLKTVFEGLFAAFQIGHSVASMSVIGGLKILNAVLDLFDLNILDVAAHIAEYIIKLRDWIKENTFLMNTWDKVGTIIGTIIKGIQACVSAFTALVPVQEFIAKVKDLFKDWFGDLKTGLKVKGALDAFNKTLEKMFTNLAEWIKSLEGMSPTEILEELSGILSKVRSSFSKFGNDILEACPPLAKLVGFFKDSIAYIKAWFSTFKDSDGMKNVLGIFDNIFGDVSSRFKEAYNIGKNVIEGLKNGLKDGSMSIGTAIGTIINGLINIVKSILGIHSPSTVFFAIGGFIIAGLIGGLLSKSPDIKAALTTIGDVIVDFFSGLDIGTVIAAGLSVGTLVMVKKALDVGDKFADAAKNMSKFPAAIGNIVENLNKGLFGKFEKSKWTLISDAILKVAIAIGILAAAVILMSLVPSDKLWNAVGALAAIAGVVALLAGVMVGLMAATKLVAEGENVGKLGTVLLKIAAAVAIMAIVAKVVSSMSWEELGKAGAAMAAFGLLIVGFMAATELISGSKNVDKIGGALFKIAAAIAVMMLVAKLAASMTDEELMRGGTAVAAFSVILIGLMAATKLINGSKNVDTIGGTLFKMSAAIAVMILVAKMAASMSNEELIRGGLAITAFSGILVGLMAATKLINGSKNVGSIGGTLFKMAAAIAIMVIVAKLAASMLMEEIVRGTAVIVAFSGILVGLMAATKLIKGSESVGEIGGALIKIAGAIAIMLLVAKIAASMSVGDLVKGTIAVAAFAGIIVGLMAATKVISGSSNVDKIGNTLLKIAGAIAIIGFMVVMLSFIKPEKLLAASASLGLVMGMFAIILKVSETAKMSIGSLIFVTVAVGLIAGMIYLLSTLGAESALSSAASISMLLLSMAGALALMNMVGPSASNAVKNLALMGLVVAELAIILGVMSYFNVSTSMETVMGISVLLLTMAGVLAILSLIGPSAMTGAGAMAVLGLVVGELALILGLMSYFDVTPSIETAKALSILLASMSASLILLGVVGMMGPAAFVGIAALATLIAAVGSLIVGIGALVSKFPQLETFLDTGMPILEKIGYAIGSFFGNIIGGFASGVLDGLPEIGTRLSEFMINATPFIVGAKLIDPAAMDGVKALAETILILTAADVVDSLTSWFTGGSSLADFGKEIAAFAPFMRTYADAMAGIDANAVEASAIAAKALAEMANNLPSSGGIMSEWFGSNDMSTFGASLVAFGTSLVAYSVAVTGLNTEAISGSVTAAQSLSDLANALPNTGGIVSWWSGDNDMATFGTSLVSFGESLSAYSTSVAGVNAENISKSVTAAESLSALAEALPNSGGIASWWSGDNDIEDFGKKMKTFGDKLTEYSTSVSGLDTGSVTNSVKSAKQLVGVVKSMNGLDTSGAESFKDAINSLASTSVADFVSAFNVSTDQLTAIGSGMIDSIVSGINSNVGMLKNNASIITKTLISAINTKKADIKEAGIGIVTKFANGIEKKDSLAKKAMGNAAKSAVTEVRDYYDNFYNAGSYLVSGFVQGIDDNITSAANKAAAMANAAEKAAKEALDINSPSKVFRRIGMSVPEGFAQGIDRLKNVVTASSVSMSDTAIYAVQDSISRIADVISTDIDSQPTIRPVLDLSDVSAGARSISGMFAMSPSVGVLANAGSISNMMNNRQNGANNDDVVAAIKDLKDALGEVSGDSYSVGDITYDDGSNINNAVEALIGAVRRERRT